jgi:hypothetical protein
MVNKIYELPASEQAIGGNFSGFLWHLITPLIHSIIIFNCKNRSSFVITVHVLETDKGSYREPQTCFLQVKNIEFLPVVL